MSKQIPYPRGAQWRYFVLIAGCLLLLIACSGEDEAPNAPSAPDPTTETAEITDAASAEETAVETSTVVPTAAPPLPPPSHQNHWPHLSTTSPLRSTNMNVSWLAMNRLS